MSAPDAAGGALAAHCPRPATAACAQFPTAIRFAIRNQARNRLAALLLVGFVPAWYLLMMALTGHAPLSFRLYATGHVLTVDGGELTLISAGLNALTIITGFAVFHAVHTTLGFDRRLVFAGYRQATLIAAKVLATSILAAGVAIYAGLVLLAFWRPSPAGWLAITTGYAAMSITYGALGLLLGVLVRGDLEGFFLIMGGLMDTFLQNPLGNPLANKPILEWFPSFGPMQFAVGGAFGHTWLASHLLLGLAWAAGFTLAGLIIFRIRTHSHQDEALPGEEETAGHIIGDRDGHHSLISRSQRKLVIAADSRGKVPAGGGPVRLAHLDHHHVRAAGMAAGRDVGHPFAECDECPEAKHLHSPHPLSQPLATGRAMPGACCQDGPLPG